MLEKSASVGEVARVTGLTRQTVYRIKGDQVGAGAALAIWGSQAVLPLGAGNTPTGRAQGHHQQDQHSVWRASG
jgi:hypothetical protein